jgi:lysyl-tRNA synthetase class 2
VATPSHVFPSDLADDAEGELLVCGRVTEVDRDRARISDAFASIEVHGHADVDVGDLVMVSVRRARGKAELVAVIERHRPSVAEGAETKRFLAGGVGSHLRMRARVFATIRSYFARERFVEVDTPLHVPSPGLDLHLDAVRAEETFLVTSPEYQMKRLLSGGLPRIFQIAHVFRHGEVGTRHNPEFTMLEWYRAFAGVDEVMRDTEMLVAEVGSAVGPGSTLRGENGSISIAPPFPRISVAEAFERHAGVSEDRVFSIAENDPETYFRILVDKVEPELARLSTPVFLIDFPISQASLARAKPTDPRVCERFELYAGGIELCNGFGELTDSAEQRRRFRADQEARAAAGKPVYPIDERFLAALDEGMPPSAGNALGIDRLLALAVDEPEIARVMPFPNGHL